MSKVFWIPLIMVPFVLGGCVLKAQHNDVLAKGLKCESELQGASKNRDEARAKLEDCQKKSSDFESRNQELSDMNQMLANKNSEFSKRSLDAQKELLKFKQDSDKTEKAPPPDRQTFDELSRALDSEIKRGDANLDLKPSGLSLSLRDRALFAPNGTQLQLSGNEILRKLVPALRKSNSSRFFVEVYTNGKPIPVKLRKIFPTDWEFTGAKAAKIVRFLETNGVDPLRLRAVGGGESPHERQIEIVMTAAHSN